MPSCGASAGAGVGAAGAGVGALLDLLFFSDFEALFDSVFTRTGRRAAGRNVGASLFGSANAKCSGPRPRGARRWVDASSWGRMDLRNCRAEATIGSLLTRGSKEVGTRAAMGGGTRIRNPR